MLREVSVQDIEMDQPEHGIRLRESAVENDRVSKQYSYDDRVIDWADRHDAVYGGAQEKGRVLQGIEATESAG